MIPLLFEAAVRALVVALAVGIGLRLLQVRNVLAQKVAWGLVLAASLATPAMIRWRWLPASAQVSLHPPSWLLATKHSIVPPHALSVSSDIQPLSVSEIQYSSAPEANFAAEPKAFRSGRYPAPAISSGANSAPAAPRAVEIETTQDFWNKAASAAISICQKQPGAVIPVVYLTVCGLLLLRMLYGLAVAAMLWMDAQPVEPGMIANIAAGAPVRSSAAVFSPVTIGSGILLPEDFAEWDAEKLRIVLAHERSHLRQGDFYLQLLAGVYAAVFWFSPLGWWLKRQLSDLGEAISDRAGLYEAASRTSYAQVLLEFAAMPRPTLTGVAMARSTNLSHRIERLLNDTIFHQSFASSRRALLMGLLFPLALIAATSMVRVEAAGQTPPPAPPQAPAVVPSPAPAPPAAPEAPLTGVSEPDVAPPAPVPAAPNVVPPAAPAPPYQHVYGEIHDEADEKAYNQSYSQSSSSESDNSFTSSQSDQKGKHVLGNSSRGGYSYSYSSNGDSWAVVTGADKHISFSGEWNDTNRAAIEKARKLSGGKFLWFTHGGKSYMIDDPAVVSQIQAMYKPMEELGRQQEELGRQQEKLGQEQERLGKEQAEARVPTPDMSREIAEVDAAMAKLKAEKNTKLSQEELAEIQGKLAGLEGRLGEMEGRIGEQQGLVGEKQGHLGELQGKLGEQQGRLGEQEGKLAEEADRKVKLIIDQSLGSGKAKPVE